MLQRTNRMLKVQNILSMIAEVTLDESVQQMIKDMKSVQHGDRTNKMYDILSDYHMEGGVWKHTLLAIEALPKIADMLSTATEDTIYNDVYAKHINDLRAAALFHDIGKLGTQEPSSKRPGSYSFPKHSKQEIIKTLFDKYDIQPSQLVNDLVAGHHYSPAEVSALLSSGEWSAEKVALLMILKGSDNMAVGPRGVHAATTHVAKFLQAMDSLVDQDIPEMLEWSVEDIDWAEGQELGFNEPESDLTPGGHVAGRLSGEPGEETIKNIETSGTKNLVVTISSKPYEGDFTKDIRDAGSKDDFESVLNFVSNDVYLYLENQPGAPSNVKESVVLEVVPAESFDIDDTSGDAMIFDVILNVNW